MVLITKEQSNFIKGIAICLMLFHHLFTYSERFPSQVEIIWLSNSFHYERYLGEVGKYCIPLFLFISGYGFANNKKERANQKYYLNKIYLFFIAYWLVFSIFIPLSYFFSSHAFVTLNAKEFMLNFLGVSDSFNREWWFVSLYLVMLSITPLLFIMRNQLLPVFAISGLLYGLSFDNPKMYNILFWQPAYVLGFYVGINREYMLKIYNNTHYRFWLSISSAAFLILGLLWRDWDCMPFFVIFFVLWIRIIFGFSPPILRRLIEHIGCNSLFIWLTHSFYCYHFAKEFIYSPRYTMLIFINLLVVSYLSALILNYIYVNIICKLKAKGLIFKEI
ncbi:acyltransferase family protein [Ursidibacter sp. B-7004-1]